MKKQQEQKIFKFTGRLTIYSIAEMKAQLVQAYESASSLTLELNEVESVDLSFFQLLCSLHRSALHDKKKVDLKLPVSPLVRDMMSGMGYERRVSCTEEGEDTCFFKTITEGGKTEAAPTL